MYQVLEVLMKKHKETPAELSRATGIPQNTISNWKARKGGMSIENIMRIASHYGMTAEELLEMKKG